MRHPSVYESPRIGNGGIFFRAPELPDDEISRIRELLRLVRQVVGWEDGPPRTQRLDAYAAESALTAAHDEVVTFMNEQLAAGGREERIGRATVLLNQLGQARVFLRDALLSAKTTALTNVQQSLNRLRHVTTVAQLLERGKVENTELGFQRTLVSRVEDSYWVPRTAHIPFDPSLEQSTVDVGRANRRKLDATLLETEMVRRRTSLCVMDAQSNPRTHPEMMRVTGTLSYVGAPIVSGSTVVGFVHADCFGERDVDDYDRQLIGLFAEGFGIALERVTYLERLRTLRQKFDDYTKDVADLADSFVGADVEMAPADSASQHDAGQVRGSDSYAVMRRHHDDFGGLTRRELEILTHMASGETNTRIAHRLVISEVTVKSHVKRILRKLGAANRAEAVSLYLRHTLGRRDHTGGPGR
ncbi:MAG: GAF domain-containing protein [Actinophytocola sp.]|nr:GAF domain-containing protein [Actinophytocola sp.]